MSCQCGCGRLIHRGPMQMRGYPAEKPKLRLHVQVMEDNQPMWSMEWEGSRTAWCTTPKAAADLIALLLDGAYA